MNRLILWEHRGHLQDGIRVKAQMIALGRFRETKEVLLINPSRLILFKQHHIFPDAAVPIEQPLVFLELAHDIIQPLVDIKHDPDIRHRQLRQQQSAQQPVPILHLHLILHSRHQIKLIHKVQAPRIQLVVEKRIPDILAIHQRRSKSDAFYSLKNSFQTPRRIINDPEIAERILFIINKLK